MLPPGLVYMGIFWLKLGVSELGVYWLIFVVHVICMGFVQSKNTGPYIFHLSQCLVVLVSSALTDIVDILSVDAYKLWVFVHLGWVTLIPPVSILLVQPFIRGCYDWRIWSIRNWIILGGDCWIVCVGCFGISFFGAIYCVNLLPRIYSTSHLLP